MSQPSSEHLSLVEATWLLKLNNKNELLGIAACGRLVATVLTCQPTTSRKMYMPVAAAAIRYGMNEGEGFVYESTFRAHVDELCFLKSDIVEFSKIATSARNKNRIEGQVNRHAETQKIILAAGERLKDICVTNAGLRKDIYGGNPTPNFKAMAKYLDQYRSNFNLPDADIHGYGFENIYDKLREAPDRFVLAKKQMK